MAIVLVNFGGPRNLGEIGSFLTELLCDQDVIQTAWPRWIHRWFFKRVAQKRALKIAPDYDLIGGGSPIYRDTEEMGRLLGEKLSTRVFVFHRYLKDEHNAFFQAVEACGEKMVRVLPCFPQFSYATTGSIARFFSEHLSTRAVQSLRWVQSYPNHPAFIQCYYRRMIACLKDNLLEEKEVAFLFSCHGLPRRFIEQGDIYESECLRSFEAISNLFPHAICRLSYQSKFGKGEWLRPYTDEMCNAPLGWTQGRRAVIIVPLSFTSDHIETLYEIEKLYLPLLEAKGLIARRCPAINVAPDWIDALAQIVQTDSVNVNHTLIRK